jgi:hypothetical protein
MNTDAQITLSEEAQAQAALIARDASALFASEDRANEARAKLHRAFFMFVAAHGHANVEAHAKALDFTTNSTALKYHVDAQYLLDVNIFHGTTKEQKAARQTRVRPFAQVLDMLFRCRDEHEHLNEAEWLAWYREEGQQSGLIQRLSNSNTAGASKELDPEPTPESIVDGVFDSSSAITLADIIQVPSLVPGKTILLLARQDENGTMFVPLPNAGPATLASVAGYRASAMEGAPLPLVFWHELITIGSAIIPDGVSDEPVTPLAVDDEVNSSTDLLPSNATYLFTNGYFSVASARAHDTRIVELVPRERVDLGLSAGTDRFMDKKTRSSMQERLAQPGICEGYSGDNGILVVTEKARVRVKFTHADRKLNGQLAFPPLTEFRTNWTSRVSNDFSPTASATMDAVSVAAFEREFLGMLASKRKDDRAVTISVTANSVGFKRDKAKTANFAASVEGTAEARVMQSELLAALPTLLGLQRESDLIWRLDPEGLLMVEVATRVASVRVYLQTLEKGRDTASRKLLERVKALPREPSAPVVPAEALVAA